MARDKTLTAKQVKRHFKEVGPDAYELTIYTDGTCKANGIMYDGENALQDCYDFNRNQYELHNFRYLWNTCHLLESFIDTTSEAA